ncbi:MAG: hypothetical protein LUG17_02535, partial [Clostridiales bacterium]|nr:hypothetical protein [Clostridiales bacterium]
LRLLSYINAFGGRSAKKAGGGKKGLLFALLYLYVAAYFVMLMGMFFSSIAEAFYLAGISWLYFAFYGIMAFALMFVFNVFMTQSQLYDSKDNELLLSMPVPSRLILASRIAALLLENFVYGLVAAIPALFVWLRTAPLSAVGVTAFVVITLLLPFLAFAVSGIFGFFLHLIMSRVRDKTLIGTLFSVAFLAAYFYFYTRLNTHLQTLILNSSAIAARISGGAKPLYWLGAAIADGRASYLLLVSLIILAAFGLVFAFLAVTFRRMTLNKKGVSKIKYQRKGLKASSAPKALLKKEFSRLLSSSVYLLNAGLGILFILAASVYLVIKKDAVAALASQLPGLSGHLAVIGAMLICLLLSMVLFSAPSVSLEGKSIWIPKSLPIPCADILIAKVKLHFYIASPAALITSAALIYAVETPPFMIAVAILLPQLFAGFTALLGVAVNLRFPRFDWTSEAQVVKQGVCVFICTFGTMLATIVPVMIYAALLSQVLSAELAVGIYTLLVLAADVIILIYLKTKGAERFSRL